MFCTSLLCRGRDTLVKTNKELRFANITSCVNFPQPEQFWPRRPQNIAKISQAQCFMMKYCSPLIKRGEKYFPNPTSRALARQKEGKWSWREKDKIGTRGAHTLKNIYIIKYVAVVCAASSGAAVFDHLTRVCSPFGCAR